MNDGIPFSALPVRFTEAGITEKIYTGSYSDLSPVELAWAIRNLDLSDIRQQEVGRFLAFVILSDAWDAARHPTS